MENFELQKINQEYQDRLRAMSDKQFIDAFNCEVGNCGWTYTRSLYLSALRKELKNRDFDYSDISNKEGYIFLKKIKLVGKKIVIDTEE